MATCNAPPFFYVVCDSLLFRVMFDHNTGYKDKGMNMFTCILPVMR